MGRAAMAVLRFREAAEEAGMGKATMWHAIESGCMAVEVTEDGGDPNASLPQLPVPETITTSDLAMKLEAADAAISNLQQLLGEVRISHNELRRALDEWRGRAERLTERPWWRRLAG
jgi:predicted DNA-binding transcriptional regulator AlpA